MNNQTAGEVNFKYIWRAWQYKRKRRCFYGIKTSSRDGRSTDNVEAGSTSDKKNRESRKAEISCEFHVAARDWTACDPVWFTAHPFSTYAFLAV